MLNNFPVDFQVKQFESFLIGEISEFYLKTTYFLVVFSSRAFGDILQAAIGKVRPSDINHFTSDSS